MLLLARSVGWLVACTTAVLASSGVARGAVIDLVGVVKNGVDDLNALDVPRWVAISPDGAHVYVASEDDSAVSVFARNAATGALTFVERQRDGVGGVDGI